MRINIKINTDGLDNDEYVPDPNEFDNFKDYLREVKSTAKLKFEINGEEIRLEDLTINGVDATKILAKTKWREKERMIELDKQYHTDISEPIGEDGLTPKERHKKFLRTQESLERIDKKYHDISQNSRRLHEGRMKRLSEKK